MSDIFDGRTTDRATNLGGSDSAGTTTFDPSIYLDTSLLNGAIYHDFQSSTVASINVGVAVNNTITGSSDQIIEKIFYYRNQINGNFFIPELRLNTLGNVLPPGSISWNRASAQDFSLINNGIVNFRIPLPQQGLYVDTIRLERANGSFGERIFNNLILQKAVAVTEVLNSGTWVTLGSNTSLDIGVRDTYKFRNINSRGVVTSEWQVYKTNISGARLPAVIGVDFEILSGSLTGPEIEVKFLQPGTNYRIRSIINGVTFAQNQFLNLVGNTEENRDILNHDFNNTALTLEIKFPQITPNIVIPTELILSTTPLTTYKNFPLSVNGQLLLTTGSWKVNGILQVKSLNEWLDELNASCRIELEVREVSTGSLIRTFQGLGPHIVRLPNVSNYSLQYKIVLI